MNAYKTKVIALLLITISVPAWTAATVLADDTAVNSLTENKTGEPWASPIGLFRKFISPADGDRCPMYPSCSHYAQQAFAREGLLKGWILTCDRLLRCGHDETRIAPPIRIEGTRYAYDPLEANTFWWKRR